MTTSATHGDQTIITCLYATHGDQHVRSLPGIMTCLYVCDYCELKFPPPYNLSSHQCKKCGKLGDRCSQCSTDVCRSCQKRLKKMLQKRVRKTENFFT
jgi:hypothetical protein